MTRRSDWLLAQLPMGMLDDGFFVRFVSLFQELANTLMANVDNIDNVVDRRVAPPEMLRWLGSWLGVTSIDASLPEGLQRALVAQAGASLAWRGTRQGLQGYLEAVTGAPAEIRESGGIVRAELTADDEPALRPRSVEISVASTGWLSEPDFVELVSDEIPIDVSWQLYVGDRRIHPTAQASTGTGA